MTHLRIFLKKSYPENNPHIIERQLKNLLLNNHLL